MTEQQGQTRPWGSWRWNDGTLWGGDVERGKKQRQEWEAKRARSAQQQQSGEAE